MTEQMNLIRQAVTSLRSTLQPDELLIKKLELWYAEMEQSLKEGTDFRVSVHCPHFDTLTLYCGDNAVTFKGDQADHFFGAVNEAYEDYYAAQEDMRRQWE